MKVALDQIGEWIHGHSALVWWLGGLSALTFVLTLIAIPFLVIRIPEDYFAAERRVKSKWANHHPVIRVLFLVLKNTMGVVFLAAGLAMLILPGQGLLTILIGLTLINFPGKYRFERWLVSRAPVLKAVNWLRVRGGRPAIKVD